ncbi:hypothetical protein PaeBR_03575 [Paenibacillus sp. BR2-3]|uniref:hypothetical protein n=1 Tax=Paenibacillus sp. BR2-3 TaxID=3048494 RepID=UPI0039772F69
MSKYVTKYTRLMLIVVLISTIILPASAYASSGTSSSQYITTSSYATSFFSTLAGALSSLFNKEKSTYSYTESKKANTSLLSWLKGNDRRDDDDRWDDDDGWDDDDRWDGKKKDSYKLWEKYYRY